MIAATPRSGRAVACAVLTFQLGLLLTGVDRDYRLKHEDNNALHATFARSHLTLGLEKTRGQNYFYSPQRHEGMFYPHHPPGPGLVLAAVYGATGWDGPAITRTTAAAFHLLATWLFYGLSRRVFTRVGDALLATLLFAAVPESTFFGRMMNHEVLVLPAAILLVRGYWETIDGRWSAGAAAAAMAAGAVAAALAGWAGFFVIAACGLHAGWTFTVRHNRRALRPALFLPMAGLGLFALNILHLVSVLDGHGSYLREILTSRMGADNPYDPVAWVWRIVELHWRYFSLTSVCGLAVMGYRAIRGRRARRGGDPVVEVGSIFLLAGIGYVVVFNVNAAQHDYWQFLLLPASALGLTGVFRELRAAAHRRRVGLVLLILAVFEVTATAVYTLQDRHRRTESYCLQTVATLRRDWL